MSAAIRLGRLSRPLRVATTSNRLGNIAVVSMPPLALLNCCRAAAVAARDKGVMDSARTSLVTMDEILTKVDIVLEEIIGCEIEFLRGTPSLEVAHKITQSPGGQSVVVLTSTEGLKMDHRLAVKVLTERSTYRAAFEAVFRKALASFLDVDPAAVSVISIGDMNGAQQRANLFEGALAAGGGNPALATAALATETTSRVAAWLTGSVTAANAQPFKVRFVVVNYTVNVPLGSEPTVSARLKELATDPTSFAEHFQGWSRKGTFGKLNDVLERSDSLLRDLEPRLEPGLEELAGTLARLNETLERSSRILSQVEPKVDPSFDSAARTLNLLGDVLERSECLLRRTEIGVDAAIKSGGCSLQKVDRFFSMLGGTLIYVKFALVGVGLCSFSIAYAVFRLLGPTSGWGRAQKTQVSTLIQQPDA